MTRNTLARRAAAGLGALAASSLAGCTDSDAGSEPEPPDTSVVDGMDGPAGPATGEQTRSPRWAGTSTPSIECDDPTLTELERERWQLEEELLELEWEVEPLRTSERAARYVIEQFETGFSGATVERARSVGVSAREGVVLLEILQEGASSHGTAWFVDEGYLFTNAHNVLTAGEVSELRGVTHEGDRFDLEVVGVVEEMMPDVALLRTGFRGGTSLPVGAVADLEPGQPLVQVGHPGEVGYWVTSMGRFVDGRAALTLDGDEYTALKTVVPGRVGVSGSPLLTLDGEAVGMTHGGTAISQRPFGEPAPVSPDIVFDGPIGTFAVSLHDGSDGLERLLEGWR